MRRATLRVDAGVNAPGPAVATAARAALRHSADMLGILIAEPVRVDFTDVDADGVQSLTERWAVASAYLLDAP